MMLPRFLVTVLLRHVRTAPIILFEINQVPARALARLRIDIYYMRTLL